jgi:signal peptidase I
MRFDRKLIRAEVVPFVVMLLLLTAARSSLADHYYVPSGSMEYTLLPGDRVVVDKTAYGLRVPYTKIDIAAGRSPSRGDIAVFDSPQDGVLLIKRIVAVGGDLVELREGHLSINGAALAQADNISEELFGARSADLNLNDGGGPAISSVRVPAGKLLALGDHRGNSLDGRYFGFIDERELYGRAVAIYYRRAEGLVCRPL